MYKYMSLICLFLLINVFYLKIVFILIRNDIMTILI